MTNNAETADSSETTDGSPEGSPVVCHACGETAPDGAKWCEACGSDLVLPAVPEPGAGSQTIAPVPIEPELTLPPATEPCVSCAAAPTEITPDGWCGMCGTKQPAPGDHVVDDHGWFAVVSDRGRIHRTNEDAGAVGAVPADGARANRLALVVCDGVSSTDDSQHASQAAAASALHTLLTSDEPAGDALARAAAAAQQAVLDATPAVVSEPPSCTFVAAVAEPISTRAAAVDPDSSGAEATNDQARITVAWLGDSRAYWLDHDGARLLTRDHSWAIEQLDLGVLDADVIAADHRAHSITRWLGADAVDLTPDAAELIVDGPGLLLVCSDGLWNYTDSVELLAQTVADNGGLDAMPIELAELLVAFANASGGHDNITVALARFPLVANPTPDTPMSDTPSSPPETPFETPDTTRSPDV